MKSWFLEDTTETVKTYKYTFYVPSQPVIDALKLGDLARIIFVFHSDDPNAPRAERMWVEIKSRSKDSFTGYLTNQPLYIKDLNMGDIIEFESKHIIDTNLEMEEDDLIEKYINRCLISKEVIDGKKKVKYLYREESLGDQRKGIYDSGWRIFSGEETQEYVDNPSNIAVVSLGAILNIDESIIECLDAVIGSEFEWSETENMFNLIK